MATTTDGKLTIVPGDLHYQATAGVWDVQIQYFSVATGHLVATRTMTVPANTSNPILDQFGTQVAATVPSGISTPFAAAVAGVVATVNNAAPSGVFDFK